jgi:peptide/nickel transport system substrate-binding protein
MRRPGAASSAVALLGLGALALLGGCRRATPPAAPSGLLVLVPEFPDVFDPFESDSRSGDLLYFNVFEPLVRLTPSGSLEPVLARSWDDSRPEELSLELRPDTRFHDGTPLAAGQVAASLEAARRSGGSLAPRLADVAEARAEGDRVVLRGVPGATLTIRCVADVPILKPGPTGGLPSGTGPYRVSAFTSGESAVLEAAASPVPETGLARIAIRRFHDAEDVVKSLTGTATPLVLEPPPEPLALARSHERYRVVTQPGSVVIGLGFDVAREPTPGIGLARNPFRSPAVRRAIGLAVDREALRKALPEGGLVATQVVPPWVFGFDPRLEPGAPRPEEARTLLRQAGLAGGFAVRLDLPRGLEALARTLASQLESVGIRPKLNPLAASALPGVLANEGSLALEEWRAQHDAAWTLRSCCHTRTSDRRFGRDNWNGWSDAEADRAIERGLSAGDAAGRREALQAALRRLALDSAWAPLLVPNRAMVLPKGLTFPARADGRISLAEARLEPQPVPTPPGRQRQDRRSAP